MHCDSDAYMYNLSNSFYSNEANETINETIPNVFATNRILPPLVIVDGTKNLNKMRNVHSLNMI